MLTEVEMRIFLNSKEFIESQKKFKEGIFTKIMRNCNLIKDDMKYE